MGVSRRIPSPCIGVCMINPDSDLCIGCWRDMDEITGWPKLDDAGRENLLTALKQRQQAAGVNRRRQTRRRQSSRRNKA